MGLKGEKWMKLLKDHHDFSFLHSQTSKGKKSPDSATSPRVGRENSVEANLTSVSLPKYIEARRYICLERNKQRHPSDSPPDQTTASIAGATSEVASSNALKSVEDEARDSVSKLSLRNKTKPIEIITGKSSFPTLSTCKNFGLKDSELTLEIYCYCWGKSQLLFETPLAKHVGDKTVIFFPSEPNSA